MRRCSAALRRTMKIYYKRRLPHWQPPGAEYFVTYRLHGSIPQTILFEWRKSLDEAYRALDEKSLDAQARAAARYQLQRRYFAWFDDYLDQQSGGPHWLTEPGRAKIVLDSLMWCHERFFKLWAVCLMSNHVHILFTHLPEAPELNRIMMQHKAYTARLCNRSLNRLGAFWQEESYDHVVRNHAEFWRIVHYILNNPVKAGLVRDWQEYRWNWLAAELL